MRAEIRLISSSSAMKCALLFSANIFTMSPSLSQDTRERTTFCNAVHDDDDDDDNDDDCQILYRIQGTTMGKLTSWELFMVSHAEIIEGGEQHNGINFPGAGSKTV